jgi:fatty-acyl-CoA synthase
MQLTVPSNRKVPSSIRRLAAERSADRDQGTRPTNTAPRRAGEARQKWGETPCAFVELKPSEMVSSEELIGWCRENLAGYKIPRHIVFAELPKTSTGKIQKFRLREMANAL